MKNKSGEKRNIISKREKFLFEYMRPRLKPTEKEKGTQGIWTRDLEDCASITQKGVWIREM